MSLTAFHESSLASAVQPGGIPREEKKKDEMQIVLGLDAEAREPARHPRVA